MHPSFFVEFFRKFILVLLFFTITFSCEEVEEECKLSGILDNNFYLFWVKDDVDCGQITVSVIGPDGKALPAINDVIRITLSSQPPDCSFQIANLASFALPPGSSYSYTAACTGKSWRGKIAKTCEMLQCIVIQLE